MLSHDGGWEGGNCRRQGQQWQPPRHVPPPPGQHRQEERRGGGPDLPPGTWGGEGPDLPPGSWGGNWAPQTQHGHRQEEPRRRRDEPKARQDHFQEDSRRRNDRRDEPRRDGKGRDRDTNKGRDAKGRDRDHDKGRGRDRGPDHADRDRGNRDRERDHKGRHEGKGDGRGKGKQDRAHKGDGNKGKSKQERGKGGKGSKDGGHRKQEGKSSKRAVSEPWDGDVGSTCRRASSLEEGSLVIIHGLKGAVELNDQEGTCVHYDHSAARWHVKLPSGEVKALKQENLQPVEERSQQVSSPRVISPPMTVSPAPFRAAGDFIGESSPPKMPRIILSPEEERAALKKRLFFWLDADGDGFLNKSEMHRFAKLAGFEGSDEAWSKAYEKLCKQCAADEDIGVPEAKLMALLDDQSDSGFYCTDGELKDFLRTSAHETLHTA
eukprot:gnl/TRDRNA2_/TRDRNA2_42841_c0_seq1.p1 gnl/TRDRNA2_/TRDRNA2_42841_c0~~gnl/TRDRNA2_/TRDRNA2_42841_c0_seq1.p1  ORF type:complete len:435 (+),score=72.12 gnl/TRDRNA2_/TRDRNA2_42841_c0_seq1:81-1385(+)